MRKRKSYPFMSDYAVSPGEILKDILQELNIEIDELVSRTKLSHEHIDKILNAKKSITINTARCLKRALNIPISFWVNAEQFYQETKARLEKKNEN